MKTLYYFTSSYPFGLGANWKQNELEEIRQYYDRVIVIPAYYAGNPIARDVPPGIEYQKPLIRVKHNHSLRYYYSKFVVLFGAILNLSPCKYHAHHFFTQKVYRKRTWLKTWLEDLLLTRYYYKELRSRHVLADRNAVFYFFWGTGIANIVPYLNRQGKTIVKFHGGDLYREQNNGYLRLVPEMFDNLDAALFISQDGLSYAARYFPHYLNKMRVYRLGTYYQGLSIPSDDDCTRIVSCSYIVPVKRLSLLTEALMLCKQEIEWIHIGGGPGFDELYAMTRNLPSNIKATFVGQVSPNQVMKFYVNQRVDLFINVSSSEGIPVSIMEAISAGIPVIATDVGGVSEIVDNSIGKLINPNITAAELAKEIDDFSKLSQEDKMKFRANAFQHFNSLFNATSNNKALAQFLVEMQ